MGRTAGQLHEAGTPAFLVDLLSTELRWMNAALLEEITMERRGVSRSTARTSLHRLHKSGMVQRRLVDNNETQGGFRVAEYYSDVWAAGNAS